MLFAQSTYFTACPHTPKALTRVSSMVNNHNERPKHKRDVRTNCKEETDVASTTTNCCCRGCVL